MYEGAENQPLPELSRPIPESATRMGRAERLPDDPHQERQGDDVTRLRYDCPDGAEVELHRLEGGGHQWPGDPNPAHEDVLGPVNTTISATHRMWEFFTEHPMDGGT